jgi:predicted DNA repair protein MutK
VPSALAISAVFPWLVIPLLMIGGAFLCFEGVEKLAHKFFHNKSEDEKETAALLAAANNPATDLVAFEKEKIKGAIRTDFILSAEIITITLGTVANSPFSVQVTVLSLIAILMTVGVYGLVAGIVKLDDLGLFLAEKKGSCIVSKSKRKIGRGILLAAPLLMKSLSVLGTIAMFLVGGGILVHGVPVVYESIHGWAHSLAATPMVGGVLEAIFPGVMSIFIGLLVGAIVLAAVLLVKKLLNK